MKEDIINLFTALFTGNPEMDDIETALTDGGYSFEYKWVDLGTMINIWTDPVTAAENKTRGIMGQYCCDLHEDEGRFVFTVGRIGNTLHMVITKKEA